MEGEGLTVPQIVDPAGVKIPRPRCRPAAWRWPRAAAPPPAIRRERVCERALGCDTVPRAVGQGIVLPHRRHRGNRRERSSRGSRREDRHVQLFSRGGVGPAPGGAATGVRPAQPHDHRPAARVAHVADRPVAALASSLGGNGDRRPRHRGRADAQAQQRRGTSRDPPRQSEIMLRRIRRSIATSPRGVGPQHNPRRNIIRLMRS